jgi:DNA-binding transcriptional MerR regulator
MSDDLPRAYYPLSVLSDLMHDLREQERAREAGITYDAVRAILADWRLDDGDSFGRTIERLRSLTLEAAAHMAEEESHQLRLMAEEAARAENLNALDAQKERASVLALLDRELEIAEAHDLLMGTLRVRQMRDIIERGEHRKEEP